MSTRKKSNNFVQRIFKQIWRFFDVATKAVVNRLLKSLLLLKRQSRLGSRAGFVLPTVVMVILVVTLLTTAIMIRSFDRSKNASNVRVDQAVLNAATPAIDRARAKIDKLFSTAETDLEGNTPPEANIATILENTEYTLGDETQIQLTGEFPTAPADTEARTLRSAWKFPVDTNNNGKFDTFTLYGIYFRSPTETENRPRGTTEARALPQNVGQANDCPGGGSGGVAGWNLIGGQLKKAFFTYVANVPITDTTGLDANTYEPYTGNKGFSALEMQLDQARIALDNNAVWFNDDININSIPSLRLNGRVHTNSNLLVSNPGGFPIQFLQVSSPESCFYQAENARIIVGGNFAAGDLGSTSNAGTDSVTVDLFRDEAIPNRRVLNSALNTTTSGPDQVAGNSDAFSLRLDLLVQGAINLHDQDANVAGAPTEASVTALASRIPQEDREEFIEAFKQKFDPNNPGGGLSALTQTLETYFANRIRRVSFAEVAITDPPTPDAAITSSGGRLSAAPAPTDGSTFVFASGQLTPPTEWMTIEPTNTTTGLTLNINGSTMQMPATDPGTGAASTTRDELEIGDRIIVGNNLPNRWLKPNGTFAEEKEEQPIPGVNWNNGGGQRTRRGVAEQLDDLGNTSRNGFWETAAAKLPPLDTEDLAGGLRVVTGAGIYVDGVFPAVGGTGRRMSGATPVAGDRSFLPEPTLDSYYASAINPTTGTYDPPTKAQLDANLPPNPIVVWPDSMPMYQWINRGPAARKAFGAPGVPEQLKGDLQMRATAVYHYKSGSDEPIACVSSYYDPTDPYTAQNNPSNAPTAGMSNNGISYGPPTGGRAVNPKLRRQSRMVFPDGRWANKPLYDAIANLDRNRELSLADKAAIDAANCAFEILAGTLTPSPSIVPDGAIKEAAFLDARQIKAIHKVGLEEGDATTLITAETKEPDLNNPDHLKMASREELIAGTEIPEYTLPLEQRQPLEIRVTEIDLDLLRTTAYAGDFLLPNSGIIYATRDDALPDLTATQTPANQRPIEIRAKKNQPSKAAATDFKLDPTRHPNGIRLINGSNLERNTTYKPEEKGLILASDLPVYVKGDFNVHRPSGATSGTLEEFSELLDATSSNFYTRNTRDGRFACRADAPTGCVGSGDQWRGARILSDAITLLSNDFRDGYRYEGDYDLRNNAGNLAVESYLDKGFWMNSFATTARWYDAGTGLPQANFADDVAGTSNRPGSSYVMNGVTPIQRRVNFPVYKMEICKKLPASECGPQDWVGASIPGGPQDGVLAGTTEGLATPPTLTVPNQYASEHYPRRVAFQRDPATGQLVLDPTGNHAQPLRPGGQAITYAPGSIAPAPQDNTLWFATTSAPSNPSPATPSFNGNGLLYYAPDEPEAPTTTQPFVHERQLLLPGTPVFPQELYSLNTAFKGDTNQSVLNGITPNDPSDFAVCTPNLSSKLYQAAVTGPACPAVAAARTMRQALFALTAPAPNTDLEKVLSVDTATLDLTTTPTALTAPATRKVNLFDLTMPTTGGQQARRTIKDLTLTFDANGQSDPIFIIRRPTGFGLAFTGVKLELKGVDPNNIFWLAPNLGPVDITGGANELVGNFLGRFGKLTIDDGAQIKGGRFLGFNANSSITGSITALTTTAQPLVVPVVQLHSPTGTPGAANNDPLQTAWLQRATPTTFNAVFVMGDSPPRLIPNGEAESNGGLGNFPRFLEAWGDDINVNTRAAKISGGLYQLKRSAVATAPFETITNPAIDTSLFLDTSPNPTLSTQGVTDYLYRGGSSGSRAAYYIPPDRQWGYDVGLLSQTPDLFSRRFVPKETDPPNEFFREVAKDDNWVRTLLCGNTIDPTTGNATTPALPPGQRPTNCPT